MPYVLKTERQRIHAKTGQPYTHVSYYKGSFHGIAHEFTRKIEDARKFHGRALAEMYAKNKGVQYDTVARV